MPIVPQIRIERRLNFRVSQKRDHRAERDPTVDVDAVENRVRGVGHAGFHEQVGV